MISWGDSTVGTHGRPAAIPPARQPTAPAQKPNARRKPRFPQVQSRDQGRRGTGPPHPDLPTGPPALLQFTRTHSVGSGSRAANHHRATVQGGKSRQRLPLMCLATGQAPQGWATFPHNGHSRLGQPAKWQSNREAPSREHSPQNLRVRAPYRDQPGNGSCNPGNPRSRIEAPETSLLKPETPLGYLRQETARFKHIPGTR